MPATDSQLDSPHRSASTGLPVFTPYDSLPSGWTPSQGGRVTMEDVDGLKRNNSELAFQHITASVKRRRHPVRQKSSNRSKKMCQ